VRQVVQNLRAGGVDVVDVPPPQLRAGGALVLTRASLISAGTERSKLELAEKSLVGKARARPDMARQVIARARQEGIVDTYRTVMDRLEAPAPLGYSAAGVVLEAADDCPGLAAGDLVACGGGGYANHAELNFVPRNLLARVPDGVRADQAAFATLGSIALHGVRQADVRLGDRVVVIGLGLVGLMAVQLARAAGAGVLAIDVDPDACALATAVGADAVARRSDAVEALAAAFTAGAGADAVLVCASTASNDPVELAGRLCRDRGRVVIVGAVGMQVPRDTYYGKELELRLSRSYGPGRYDPSYEEGGNDYPIGYVRWTEQRNMAEFLRLVASGAVDVDALVSHRFPLEEAPAAYRTISGDGDGRPVGVLLEYDAEPEQAAARRVPLAAPAPRRQGAVGLGAIGAGSFATRILLPAFAAAGAELVGIASTGGVSARTAALRFGFAYATADVEALLHDADVDAVAIATRHDSHASLAAAALSAGKSVFCEKPLATTWEELDRVAEAYEASGAALAVGFNRRHAPHTKALIAALPAGLPRAISCRVNAGPVPAEHWTRDGRYGGRIVGELCHFLDLAAAIAEQPPVRVHASALPEADARAPADSLVVQVEFACGSVASLLYLGNGDTSVPKERIEVFCGGTVATIDDFRRLDVVRDGRRKVERTRRREKGHREEVGVFLAAVAEAGRREALARPALWSSALTLQVLESLRTGGPVPVPAPGRRLVAAAAAV
jgi:predicted dehydrogenase/threonine dehydrogenase-like Zn-dependent dehydrogenase